MFACVESTCNHFAIVISVVAAVISALSLWQQWCQRSNETKLSLLELRMNINTVYSSLASRLAKSIEKNANNFRGIDDAEKIATEWFLKINEDSTCLRIVGDIKDVFKAKQALIDESIALLGKARYVFTNRNVIKAIGDLCHCVRTLAYYASENAGGIRVWGEKVAEVDAEKERKVIVRICESWGQIDAEMKKEMTVV